MGLVQVLVTLLVGAIAMAVGIAISLGILWVVVQILRVIPIEYVLIGSVTVLTAYILGAWVLEQLGIWLDVDDGPIPRPPKEE